LQAPAQKNGWDLVKENHEIKGLLVVLSGPSGAGKDTVIKILRSRHAMLHYTVTVTTRKPREGEIDWENYHFVSREEFEDMLSHDEFLEWVEYNGNYYGTPKSQIHRALKEGKIVVLKIEVQGAKRIKKLIPDAIFVFITTPSREELVERLKGRQTDLLEEQKKRLAIAEEELQQVYNYDYLIINHNDQAIVSSEKVWSIMVAESCRVGRKDIAKYIEDTLTKKIV